MSSIKSTASFILCLRLPAKVNGFSVLLTPLPTPFNVPDWSTMSLRFQKVKRIGAWVPSS
eukprot:6674475-Pyramimonas_sp.AAC.1